MSVFDSLPSLRRIAIWGGAEARAVQGRNITFAVIDLEPGSSVPEHHHPSEQVGLVLRGEITLSVAGETRSLGTGDTYVIPSEVPHSAQVGRQGCSVVDTFSPLRDDWERLPTLEPAPGAWPA